jgi:hypothetical protein
MRASGFPLASIFLLLPGLASANPDTVGIDLDPRIYGGTPVESCGWPSTVSMQGSCTGTLVHPQVVVYAAHCGSGYGSIRFGETIQGGPGFSAPVEFCRTNPAFNGNNLGEGVDFAFCKLAQPVTGVEIVPILMGCETSILVPGEQVTVVGYGNADNGPYGIKREVTTQINSVANEAYVGGNGVGACNGDSGGPVFIKLRQDIGGDDLLGPRRLPQRRPLRHDAQGGRVDRRRVRRRHHAVPRRRRHLEPEHRLSLFPQRADEGARELAGLRARSGRRLLGHLRSAGGWPRRPPADRRADRARERDHVHVRGWNRADHHRRQRRRR